MNFSTDALASALAERLELARTTAAGIDPPPELATLSLTRAYDVQDALAALRVNRGGRGAGWKLGLTSPVKQRIMGITHPLFGRIFADGERASGDRVAHEKLIAPRSEPELAFGLAGPIDASMDLAALTRAIEWIAPALEITDSRYRSGVRTAIELVADNTSSAGYVIGVRVPLRGLSAIPAYRTELVRNGVVVASGSSTDVLGNPVNALAELARHLQSRGLQAGARDIVLSGAITDAIPVAPADVIEARLGGLGTAAATFA